GAVQHHRDEDDQPGDRQQPLGVGDAVAHQQEGEEERVQAARTEPADECPGPQADRRRGEHEADGERTGDEDHDRGQSQRRQERDRADQRREDRAEEDEGQEHRHLGGRLAVLEEAIAQRVVEDDNRDPSGEGGQKAVAADRGAAGVGGEDEAEAVERLVLAADTHPRVDAPHQPRADAADREADHDAEDEDSSQEEPPVGGATELGPGDRDQDQDNRQDDDIVHPRLERQHPPDGHRHPLVAHHVAQDHRVGRGEHRPEEERRNCRQAEQPRRGQRDGADDQEGAGAEDEEGDKPGPAPFVEAQPHRVEEEDERQAENGDRLERGVVNVEHDDPEAARAKQDAEAEEDDREGNGGALHQPGGEGRDKEDYGDQGERRQQVGHGATPQIAGRWGTGRTD
ncbi:MAG: hypothetical protein AVDCRST_MAG88-940, partial [uncultured Thermomicrobiales bacterium]